MVTLALDLLTSPDLCSRRKDTGVSHEHFFDEQNGMTSRSIGHDVAVGYDAHVRTKETYTLRTPMTLYYRTVGAHHASRFENDRKRREQGLLEAQVRLRNCQRYEGGDERNLTV